MQSDSNNKLQYDGLYGDKNGGNTTEYIFLEPITTRSKMFNWNIRPHLHNNLYQVFIVEKGSLRFLEAEVSYPLKGQNIILIPPGKLHGLIYSPKVEGKILTLSKKFIEDIFETSNRIWPTLTDIRIFQSEMLDFSFENLLSILKNIDFELFGQHEERGLMLNAHLCQFFVELHRLNNDVENHGGNGLYHEHFRKFKRLLTQIKASRSIPEYAEKLHITPVHLNRVCKAVTGKTALEVVHQNLIGEAQKYLRHTSYSVSEIAYLLGFEYPNYFARLFRKHTGLSPLGYRRKEY